MVALPFDPDPMRADPMRADPMRADPEPVVWVLHDSKPGMISQAIGLAEATGFPYVEKALSVRAPWRWLPPGLWLNPLRAVTEQGVALSPPWPDLVIGCGRNTAGPALAIKRASGGRTIAAQVQDPRVGDREFDLMLVPAHDRRRGPNVLVTTGAVHRVTPARLMAERQRFPALENLPRPIVAVLIGGSNRAYRLTAAGLRQIATAIAAAVRASGGAAVVTPSRRTGGEAMAVLHQEFAGIPGEIWDGTGDNPYFAYLAVADAVLVTVDSISMASEAAATGKPVHVIDLPKAGTGYRKFERFHEAMRRAGITRPFTGKIESWNYPPLDDNARAGAALRALVAERLARKPL